jgi:hypothetical protein
MIMNAKNFEETNNLSDNVKQTDLGANDPVLSSELVTDGTLMNASLLHEPSLGGTIVAGDSMSKTFVTDAPLVAVVTPETPLDLKNGSSVALINREESENLRKRWVEIQSKFVDEPRSAVQQADMLVSEVLKEIVQMFADEHSSLESQWNQGEDVSTEDLRKALQHYRSFFNRLVV